MVDSSGYDARAFHYYHAWHRLTGPAANEPSSEAARVALPLPAPNAVSNALPEIISGGAEFTSEEDFWVAYPFTVLIFVKGGSALF
jgi:hypothetical protein